VNPHWENLKAAYADIEIGLAVSTIFISITETADDQFAMDANCDGNGTAYFPAYFPDNHPQNGHWI